MNGLLKFAQQFINRSAKTYRDHNVKKPVKWKYCVALEKSGYEAKCESIEGSKDLVFIWRKEGEDEIKIRLSFAEQQMWLNYLEKYSAEE